MLTIKGLFEKSSKIGLDYSIEVRPVSLSSPFFLKANPGLVLNSIFEHVEVQDFKRERDLW